VDWEAVPLRFAFHARQSCQMDFARPIPITYALEGMRAALLGGAPFYL